MEQYLDIGKIVNTHGVKGEVKIIPLTDNPERFDSLKFVFVDRKGILEKHDIETVKHLKNMVILKFKGIDDMAGAEACRDLFIKVDREHAVKLPKDSFFICDIIESKVFNENDKLLGTLKDVFKTGSNDVFDVEGTDGKQILIPALKTVITHVSIENRRITVKLPEGLIDDEI